MLLLTHWLGDFVFQSRWMGDNKASKPEAMFAHIFVYMITLSSSIFWIDLTKDNWFGFVISNVGFHLFVDVVTSNLTKYYYEQKSMHSFWCTIGFDQFLHVSMLLYTYNAVK